MFKLQPSIEWGQLNTKKGDIYDEFTNEEMLEYVQNLSMHDVVTLRLVVENIQTPCNTRINIEYANNGTKTMANGKAINVTVIISELLL